MLHSSEKPVWVGSDSPAAPCWKNRADVTRSCYYALIYPTRSWAFLDRQAWRALIHTKLLFYWAASGTLLGRLQGTPRRCHKPGAPATLGIAARERLWGLLHKFQNFEMFGGAW